MYTKLISAFRKFLQVKDRHGEANGRTYNFLVIGSSFEIFCFSVKPKEDSNTQWTFPYIYIPGIYDISEKNYSSVKSYPIMEASRLRVFLRAFLG
jgi:hypothetical protein